MRVPDPRGLVDRSDTPTVTAVSARWQASRVDVRDATRIQHASAIARLLPLLGNRHVDEIQPADVAELVAALAASGKARETIRKTITALAMILDFAGISPNPARDRVTVRLPREEPKELEPPSADHVEAVAALLPTAYRLALLVLDATGARVGELEAACVGDLDEERRAWLVRGAVSKTRKPRWVSLPDDLFKVIVERLPPRDDRDSGAPLLPGFTADRLRTAIGRACRAAGVPTFSPHALRHRRISLLHRQGLSWAEIGDAVGQKSKVVTGDTYTHVLIDPREVNRGHVLGRYGIAAV